MPLTDRAIVAFKATGKAQKHFDGGGLHIFVSPTGGKLWRLAYRFHGKSKLLSLGQYPVVTLRMARDRREEAKRLLENGIDPSTHKQELKETARQQAENTFEAIAREWHKTNRSKWVEKTAQVILSRLERHVFPAIGKLPITTVKAPELLAIVRSLETRGVPYSAHRAMQYCSGVYRYAIATGRAEHDITADLRGALPVHRVEHLASITDPRQVGQLLRALDGYTGDYSVTCALKIAPLVFVRPGELRFAEWTEFDFEAAEWRIPARRMKMREQHIVPLARQTLAILNDLKMVTGCGRFLFPSVRTPTRPMSDNTVNAALRRIGYNREEMTGHGFRSMASTLLNELGWNRDAIERQLVHGERDSVRAAYNFAEFLPERRKMMQAWADYLDELRQKA